jgi:hypothetical protein
MTLPLKTRSATILVVEDTVVVLNTVRTILQRADFTVLAASNADEAMRLAGSATIIDLLLSDVMMPDMSGPDLALKLKELRPEMRVILMSGSGWLPECRGTADSVRPSYLPYLYRLLGSRCFKPDPPPPISHPLQKVVVRDCLATITRRQSVECVRNCT